MRFRLVILVVLMTSFSSLSAKEVLVLNGDGVVVSVKQVDEPRPLNLDEIKAYENPGQEIPTGDFTTRFERVDFFHLRPILEYSQVVVFKDNKIQTFSKQNIVEQKIQLAPHVMFGLVAIVLMSLSNIIAIIAMNTSSVAKYFAFASIAAFFAFVIAAMAVFAALAVAFFALSAAIAAFAALAAAIVGDDIKIYWTLSIIFYLLMILFMLV